jgi:hypothetical protein
MILIIAILAALIAIPTGADARRGLLGTLTSPVRPAARGVFGRRTVRRRGRYRRVAVRHRRAMARAHWRHGVAAATVAAPAAAAASTRQSGAAPASQTPANQTPGSQAAAPATTAVPDGPPPGAAPAPGTQETAAPAAPARTRSLAAPSESAAPAAQAEGRRTPPRAGASGWAGAIYWPQASDDLFTYTFRPAVGGDRFWARGGQDLADGIFMRDPNAPSDWTATCGGEQSGSVWSDTITRAVQPTAAQRPAFDELTATLAKADESIRGACPAASTTVTPTQRLGAMTDRLWSMRRAVVLLRAPLEKFVAALDEPQKARFNEMSPQAERRETTAEAPAGPGPSGGACADPAAAMIAWPAERLERRVRPTPAQRESLQRLQMTTQGMGRLLMASCPTEPAATPLARLDAAEKRLDAMLYAARVVGPALHGFYDQLNEQQRAGFNALGHELRTSSPMVRGER